jgi:hypothetical protein
MKTREVSITTGEKFTVPQGIQRLDSSSTRGWQVRYQGTKYFADGTAGPQKALGAATRELLRRIGSLPAPVSIRRTPNPSKTSGLPAGISGPLLISSAGSELQSAVFSVTVPRFGQPNQTKKVHIGTSHTYTKARFKAALARAIEIRAASTALYEAAATKAKRKEATAMKKSLVTASADA